MTKEQTPNGEWKVQQIADYVDVQEGRSDKPCFKITGPDGIRGFYWGWCSPRAALSYFVKDLFGVYIQPVITERYYT